MLHTAHLRAIFAALDTQDAAGPASLPAEQPGMWPDDELARCLKRAERDPGSARRVAELLELSNCNDEAAKWWHRAADLGDEDAIDYVREFLTK